MGVNFTAQREEKKKRRYATELTMPSPGTLQLLIQLLRLWKYSIRCTMIRNADTVIQVRLWNTRKYDTLVSAGHILMESIPTQNISKEKGTEREGYR